ncbi:MAG: SpoIIE family protein phosphatase [Kiritimatiellaeota bacterium]|nr:SpoIIE family protein phosphatase [Kiritimatiellota bacterium]
MFWVLLFFMVCGLVWWIGTVLHDRFLRLREELREARSQHRDVIDFLNLFARSLATVSDIQHTMELVAHYVRDVTKAESVGIFLLQDGHEAGERRLRGAACAGMFPPLHTTSSVVLAKAAFLKEHFRQECVRLGEGILGRVAASRRSILVEDVSALPEEDKLPREVRSLMAVPMLVENRLNGVMCVINPREADQPFSEEDLRLLENLSYQAALASNLIAIYEERGERQRLVQELEFARDIQRSLLPEKPPEWGDYDIQAFTRSAREVGGDFYDFIQIDPDRLMVVVADASGKGIPACMLMAMCQSFARSCAQRYCGLEPFLRDMNHFLFQDTDRAHFVTVGICVIDRQNHICDYARAGHTELLLRLPEGISRTINPEGPALGLLPDDLAPRFDTLSFTFRPGMSLLLFTDGITEALDEDSAEFGLERLENIWSARADTPAGAVDALLRAVDEFKGDAPQADDQTLVLISRPGPALGRPQSPSRPSLV